MKRIKGTTIVSQFYIDNGSLEDIFNRIPKNFTIKELTWTGWNATKWKKLHITETLKNSGVRSATEGGFRVKITGVFKNKSREEMLKLTDKIIKDYILQEDKFWVERMVLINGSNEAAYFKRIKKNISNNSDKRKKLIVLGLVGKTGQKQLEMMSELSAGKIACQFKNTTVRQVICSEIA